MSRSRSETAGFCALVLLLNIAASVTYAAMNVELSAIGDSVSANVFLLPDAYVIAVVCALPLTPRLLAMWGARRLFTTSMIGLILTGGLTLFAHGGIGLGAAIFAHGFCAAPILPATQTLCGTRFDDEASRHRMLSFWMATTICGILLGYVAGGWLSDHLSWRLGLILCWIPAALALWLVRRIPGLAGPVSDAESFDGVSAFLLAAMMLSLSGLLVFGSHLGWSSLAVPQLTAIITATLLWFCVRYRATSNPVLDFSVLRDHRLAGALLVTFVLNASSTGVFQTEMLGTVIRLDPEWLALRAGVGGLTMLLAVLIADRLFKWTRSSTALLLGVLVLLAGKSGFLTYRSGIDMLGVIWPALVASMGYGMLSTMLAVIACHFADARKSAAAASLYAVAVQLGTSVGLASLDATLEMRKRVLLASASHLDPIERAFHDVFLVELAVAAAMVPIVLYYFVRQGDNGASVDLTV